MYTFENRCEEEPGLQLDDRSRKVFYNAEGYTGAELTAQNRLVRGYGAAEIAEVTGLIPEQVR